MQRRKKDPIISDIDEVAILSLNIRIFMIILNAIIVSLGLAIIFRIFGIYALLALFFGILYLILMSIYLIFMARLYRIKAIDSIVEKHPFMNERLQTVYDNRKQSNILIDSLRSDVASGFDKIAHSSFLELGPIMTRILVSILLVFTLLSINFIDFRAIDINQLNLFDENSIINQIANSIGLNPQQPGKGFNPEEGENFTTRDRVQEDIIGGGSGGEYPGISEGPLPGRGGGVGGERFDEIFGDPTSVTVHGENIKMEIHPEYGGEIEIENVKREMSPKYGNNLEGKSANMPEQDPVEYREIIRKYFQSLQNILREENQ